MSFDFDDYFKVAKKSCLEFDKANAAANSVEDEAAYQLGRNTMDKLIGLAIAIDKAFLIEHKIKLGNDMEKLSDEAFGPEKLPPISGSKSLAFVEKVYLPHFQRFNTLHFNPLMSVIMKNMHYDLPKKKVEQARLAKELEIKMNDFKSKTAGLGLFAIKATVTETTIVVSAVPKHSN